MNNINLFTKAMLTSAALFMGSNAALADSDNREACRDLPSHAELKAALKTALPASAGGTLVDDTAGFGPTNGGLDIPMWASVVARDGTVCAVAFSGNKFDDQWPASRAISAQKANTANALTTTNPGGGGLLGSANAAGVWSTALLYSSVQPGGSLFGLQESNPVDPAVAYAGPSQKFGRHNDPMVGKRIGGINVFGGGLALFREGVVIGGLGVSGDTSCADHNIAWRVRDELDLASNPAGAKADNIIFDDTPAPQLPVAAFRHPHCLPGNDAKETAVNNAIVQ